MKGIVSIILFAIAGMFVLQMLPEPPGENQKVQNLEPVKEPIVEVPLTQQPVITADKNTWPFGGELSPYYYVVGLFVVICVYSVANRVETIGIKRTRRGALNFLYDHFKETDTKVIDAMHGSDEGGEYDHFITRDVRGTKKDYFVDDLDQY